MQNANTLMKVIENKFILQDRDRLFIKGEMIRWEYP